MKIYELIYNEYTIRGVFFKDNALGCFFITEKIDYPFTSLDLVDLRLDGDKVRVMRPDGDKYKVHRAKMKDFSMYIFASQDSRLPSDAIYITLDDVGFSSSFPLFTGGELLEALASLCKLPNGNYIVGNVQDYITTIEDMTRKSPNKEHFFRGHYYFKYELVPSLYRKKKYYENESDMYMDFKTQFYNELSNKKYIEILTTMQHYKMPTRLLDTTSNPLVALYMACDKPITYKNKNFGIGEVIFMSEDKKNVKYSDSNIVTLMSSLAVLETNYKQELYLKINEAILKNDPSIYRNTLAYKRFVAEVKTALPGFSEELFDPEVLLHPRHVKVGMINERIIAQSGSFILFGLCDYKTGEYKTLHTVSKKRIFIVNRPYIVRQLELLNLNPGTMYPDKDHMSTHIAKSYE